MLQKRGYTPVKALITILLVGVVVAFTAFVAVVLKDRSADTKRALDMKQISRALESYYDKNAKYPGALEVLVSEGFLQTLPTPPFGTNQKSYTYVPLGENKICTGYHLGAVMEIKGSEFFASDTDSYPGIPCGEALTEDFDGTAFDCAVGVIGEGTKNDNCYDIKI